MLGWILSPALSDSLKLFCGAIRDLLQCVRMSYQSSSSCSCSCNGCDLHKHCKSNHGGVSWSAFFAPICDCGDLHCYTKQLEHSEI